MSAKSWHPFLPWLNIKICFCSHDTCIFVTVKGKTDTNGYPFEQLNRSLSVRHPFERLKKSVQSVRQTVRTVCISVRNTLASVRTPKKIRSKRSTNRSNGLHIRSKYISIRSKYCDIRSPTKSVHSENCGIRSNGLTPVLFIRSKGENCTRCFSTVIQCSRRNVAIHVHVTKS